LPQKFFRQTFILIPVKTIQNYRRQIIDPKPAVAVMVRRRINAGIRPVNSASFLLKVGQPAPIAATDRPARLSKTSCLTRFS